MNWDYTNFIKDQLYFWHEDVWHKVIFNIMYDIEYWPKEKCIKFADKLRRERLSPEDHLVDMRDMVSDSPNSENK